MYYYLYHIYEAREVAPAVDKPAYNFDMCDTHALLLLCAQACKGT